MPNIRTAICSGSSSRISNLFFKSISAKTSLSTWNESFHFWISSFYNDGDKGNHQINVPSQASRLPLNELLYTVSQITFNYCCRVIIFTTQSQDTICIECIVSTNTVFIHQLVIKHAITIIYFTCTHTLKKRVKLRSNGTHYDEAYRTTGRLWEKTVFAVNQARSELKQSTVIQGYELKVPIQFSFWTTGFMEKSTKSYHSNPIITINNRFQ